MEQIKRTDLTNYISQSLLDTGDKHLDISNEFLRKNVAMWLVDKVDDRGLLEHDQKEDGLYYNLPKKDKPEQRYFYVTYNVRAGAYNVNGDLVISRPNLAIGEFKEQALALATEAGLYSAQKLTASNVNIVTVLELSKEDFFFNYEEFNTKNGRNEENDNEA